MRPFRVSRSLIAVFILASVVPPLVSFAQTPFSISGVPPYAVQIPVPLGFVGATTGRLHLEIPFASIPERNGEPLIAKLVFDGTSFFGGGGWMLVTGTAHMGTGSYHSNSESCTAAGESGYPNGNVNTLFGFSFTDFHNTVHASTNQNVYTKQYSCYSTQGVPDPNNSYGTPSATASADDGSGYTFWVSNYTAMQIYAPDGTLVYDTTSTGYGLETPVDTNGNYENAAQVNSAPDTLGRTPFTISTSTSGCLGSGTAPATLTVKASDGSAQTYTFNCTMLSVSEVIGGNTVVVTNSFLTSITLPDNTQYSFTYDTGSTPTHVGNLLSVTLPTGGQVSFTYEPNTFFLNSCQTCTGGVAASATFGGGTWNLSYTNNSSTLNTTTTLTAPPRYDSATNSYISDVTVFNSAPNNSPFLQNVQYYSGSSTVLKAVNFGYDLYFLPLSVTTTLGGMQSTVSYQYLNGMRDYITQKQETDFSGNVVRTTTASYIGNRPTQINVYPGPPTGSPIASTLFAYDEYNANYCKNGVPMLTNITGATNHDDAGHGKSWTARGNVTTIQQLISGTSYATTHKCYDTLGKVTQTVDANGNPTSYDYSENWADSHCIPSGTITHAFPTTITDALSHQTKNSYFTCSSLLQGTKDPNDIQANRNGTTFTYDLLGRPLVAMYPDNGQTTYCYSHDPNLPCYTTTLPPFTTESRLMSGSTTFNTKTLLDAYGRVAETQIASDPDCSSGDKTDITYDGLGRVYTVSNPYCTTSDPTYGITTYDYDALGRTTLVIPPDGSISANNVVTAYAGNCTTVIDQTANARKSCSDALGRLTQVLEDPGASPHLNFETDYGYDALNNLLCVGQKGTNTGTFSGCASIPASWRPRTFVYDSLSRPTSATNPESGTISYAYDANGNLTSKTSPATVTISYCYDALNRVTSKSYTGQSCPMSSPTATYTYDLSSVDGDPYFKNPVGRLVKAEQFGFGVPVITYSDYDPVGRPLHRAQCFWQNCTTFGNSPPWWIVTNTYDLAGDLTSYTDAFGHTLTQTFDGAGRPSQLTSSWVDPTHPAATLATVGSSAGALNGYAPTGQLKNLTLANGLTESWFYNNRLQPCRINWNSSATPLAACSGSAPSGNLLDFLYGFVDSGGHNNGNVASWSAVGQQSFNRSFAYDSLNRIYSMSQSSGPATPCSSSFGLRWTIDAWGNRTDQTLTAGTCNAFHQTVNAQNQFFGGAYQYDAAGNMTNDGSHTYYYDAENRLVQVDGSSLGSVCSTTATACYLYNTDGQRVYKYMSNGANTRSYIYGSDGQIVSYTDTSGNWNLTYLYFGGTLLGEYAGTGTYFIHRDHLGSIRLGTDLNYNVNHNVTPNYDYLPFGEQLTGGNESLIKFTGKERDSESSLDNFGARYNSSNMGRFMSPDDGSDQEPTYPQSWNLYSYARNNPLIYTDPTGRDCVYLDDNGGTNPDGPGGASIDHKSNIGECQQNGGYWGYGYVDSLDWVQPDYNSDAVDIYSWQNGQMNWNVATQDTTMGAYPVNSFNAPWDTGPSWTLNFFLDLLSWQSFGAGQIHAQNANYYNCIGNKMIPFKGLLAATGAKAVEEAATQGAEHGGGKLAGAYYHFTDGRFTAWGSSSKVLVPNAAAKIAKVAKGASIAGWALTDAELADAIHACSANLTGSKE